VAHQNDTINNLHAAVRNARQPAPAAAALPTIEASAAYTLPDTAGGSYSLLAVGVRPKPGSTVLTWLFVYGRHAHPGERYGLLQATCKNQHVTTSDLADGTADQEGNLTIVAPNLAISPQEGTGRLPERRDGLRRGACVDQVPGVQPGSQLDQRPRRRRLRTGCPAPATVSRTSPAGTDSCALYTPRACEPSSTLASRSLGVIGIPVPPASRMRSVSQATGDRTAFIQTARRCAARELTEPRRVGQ